MTMTFQKATKKKAKLRLALVGPSGSGKTYTALSIAKHIGGRIAVLDTEHASASKYCDKFEFDTICPDTFSPQVYIDAIHAAAKGGYDVIVIDSLSHAWMGVGGALEMVDNAARKSQSRNTFTAWRDVTPLHNALIDAILAAPIHVIATMRAKTEYVLEEVNGKKMPRKIGIQPVQRDGMDYEFDVVADLDENHNMIIGKTRCDALDGKSFRHAGRDVAEMLTAWLTDGAESPAPLEKALSASVDAYWPKWVSSQQATLREACKRGPSGLLEAWTDVNAEIKKLNPPTEYVEQIKATKDELKSANGAA